MCDKSLFANRWGSYDSYIYFQNCHLSEILQTKEKSSLIIGSTPNTGVFMIIAPLVCLLCSLFACICCLLTGQSGTQDTTFRHTCAPFFTKGGGHPWSTEHFSLKNDEHDQTI